MIDQYTFFDIMKWFGNYSAYQLNTVYALFSFNANKLYMIIISLASAMAATAIPLLAEARAKNDIQDMRRQIENALLLFYFIMVPAALGLAAVAQQIYTVFTATTRPASRCCSLPPSCRFRTGCTRLGRP